MITFLVAHHRRAVLPGFVLIVALGAVACDSFPSIVIVNDTESAVFVTIRDNRPADVAISSGARHQFNIQNIESTVAFVRFERTGEERCIPIAFVRRRDVGSVRVYISMAIQCSND